MFGREFAKLVRDPLGVLRRFFWKTLIGPRRYVTAGRFDAESYWRDRYRKYGTSLRGAADEGLTEGENVVRHREVARAVLALGGAAGIDWPRARVLDVGCGTGFFAGALLDQGVRNYVGVDVTDVLFPRLRDAYPGFQFRRADIIRDAVPGEFDLVLMLYVADHILEGAHLSQALGHVRQCLSGHGLFVLAPLRDTSRRRFFYLREWSLADVTARLPDCKVAAPVSIPDGLAVAFRMP
jgi:SAM-dependent methyltransferase